MQALQVLLFCATKDYDIIQVDDTINEVQLSQGVLHEMLECRRCIAQPKQHAGKLIEPKVPHHEGSVLLRFWGHLICQKPDLKSINKKCADLPCFPGPPESMAGGYKSFFIHALKCLKSTQSRRVPSFFWTRMTVLHMGTGSNELLLLPAYLRERHVPPLEGVEV